MKLSSTIALLAGASTLALANADEYFTGDGTAYTLGDTSSGNCNMMSALSFATTDYAALNNDQWNGLQNCGRCAEVSCADSRCSDQTKSVVVQLLDRCPECKHGDLDLSPSVFKTLTGSDPSRYTIKWKFVDCPVPGSVNYCLKGGSNGYWTAIQPTNVATGITRLQINGKATKMLDGAYYYLLDGSGSVVADLSNVTVSLTDLNGVSMKDTVSLSAGSCTQGISQFPSASGGSSPTPTTLSPGKSMPATNTSVPTTVAPTRTSAPKKVSPTVSPTQPPTVTTLTPTVTIASPQQQTSAPVSTTPTPVSAITMAPKTTALPATTSPTSTKQQSGSSNDDGSNQTTEQDFGSASNVGQTQPAEPHSSSASGNDATQAPQQDSTTTPAMTYPLPTTFPSIQQSSASTEADETETTQQESTMASEDGETQNSTMAPHFPATVAPTMETSSQQSGSTSEGGDSQTAQQQSGTTSNDGETPDSTVPPTVADTPSTITPSTSTQQSGSESVSASESSSSTGEDNANAAKEQGSISSSSGNTDQDVDSNTETNTLTPVTSASSSTTEDDETETEPIQQATGSTGTANCPM